MLSRIFQYGSSKALIAGAQMVAMPMMFRWMGASEFGAAMLTVQLANVLRQLQLQHISQVVARETPSSLREYGTQSIKRAAGIICVGSALLTALCMLVASAWLSKWIGLDSRLIWMAYILAAVLTYSGLKLSFHVSGNRIGYVSLWEGVIALASIAATLAAAHFWSDALAYVVAACTATMLVSLFMSWEAGQPPEDGPPRTLECLRVLKAPLMSYGLPVTAAALLGWIVGVIDRFQVAGLMSLAAAGAYAAAVQILVTPANLVAATTCTVLEPLLYRTSDNPDSKAPILRFIKIFILGTVLYVATIAIAGPWICRSIFGSKFHLDHGTVALLGLTAGLGSLAQLRSSFLKQQRRAGQIFFVNALCALAILLLNWILIPVYGEMGAALSGTAVATGMIALLFRKNSSQRFCTRKNLRERQSLQTSPKGAGE